MRAARAEFLGRVNTPGPPDPRRTLAELEELRALSGGGHGAQRAAFTSRGVSTRAWLAQKFAGLSVETPTVEAGDFWATLRGESPRALLIGGQMDY